MPDSDDRQRCLGRKHHKRPTFPSSCPCHRRGMRRNTLKNAQLAKVTNMARYQTRWLLWHDSALRARPQAGETQHATASRLARARHTANGASIAPVNLLASDGLSWKKAGTVDDKATRHTQVHDGTHQCPASHIRMIFSPEHDTTMHGRVIRMPRNATRIECDDILGAALVDSVLHALRNGALRPALMKSILSGIKMISLSSGTAHDVERAHLKIWLLKDLHTPCSNAKHRARCGQLSAPDGAQAICVACVVAFTVSAAVLRHSSKTSHQWKGKERALKRRRWSAQRLRAQRTCPKDVKTAFSETFTQGCRSHMCTLTRHLGAPPPAAQRPEVRSLLAGHSVMGVW